MKEYELDLKARRLARDLWEKLIAGEITADQLKERFSNIKSPEVGVEKLSPVEHFSVKSGAMRVTDPCYQIDTWCAGTLENVKNGQWSAFASTQFDQSEVDWAKKWRQDAIDKLVLTPLSKDKVIEIFGANGRDGVPRTEENIERLGKYHGAQMLMEEIRRLCASEISAENPIGRVWYLHAHHQDHPILEMDDTWVESEIHVGVDSGQAGFVDLEWFANYSAMGKGQGRDGEWNKTYRQFCDKTLKTEFSFGCLEHAAVSSSGYGDGGYSLFYKTDDQGQVIAARIVYIMSDEEEGEEE